MNDKTRCNCATLNRRALIGSGLAAAVASPLGAVATPMPLPSEVAGVTLPQSDLVRRVTALARAAYPDFLFNHCMRTYVFGALFAQRNRLAFDTDRAFTGAALHDLGLLPAYASNSGSFKSDGAHAAETFARANGVDALGADVIWHCIAMHDTRFAARQSHEAIVVAVGAGADVNGPSSDFTGDEVSALLAAFPRLHFKTQFTALLVDQCRRKPLSQSGTWLEGLCREVSPTAWPANITQSIAASDFAE